MSRPTFIKIAILESDSGCDTDEAEELQDSNTDPDVVISVEAQTFNQAERIDLVIIDSTRTLHSEEPEKQEHHITNY